MLREVGACITALYKLQVEKGKKRVLDLVEYEMFIMLLTPVPLSTTSVFVAFIFNCSLGF